MAVMEDLISESSNVVGVSSTGQFRPQTRITNKSLLLKLVVCVYSTFKLFYRTHQILSHLRKWLMRVWRGLWWRVSWQRSVSWQQPYCSALWQPALSISNIAANSSVNQVGLPVTVHLFNAVAPVLTSTAKVELFLSSQILRCL